MHALILDVGNTSVKVGIADKQSLKASYALPTDSVQGGDLLGLRLDGLIKQAVREIGPLDIRCCLASSVVPGMDPLLKYACQRFLNITVYFAHKDLSIPMENRYERPAEVGADRLVAAYAARNIFPDSPGIISIDFGTATTFDCVAHNAYIGGLICPGVLSSLNALAQKTAQLPRIPLTVESTTLSPGRSTITSMNQGFLFGFAAMSEGLCARLFGVLPKPCKAVATGGFARAVAQVCHCIDAVCPDLILEGLRTLWLRELPPDTKA